MYERTIRVHIMKLKSQSFREYRGERLQALSVRQAQLVDAIAARILPTTDTPGAVGSASFRRTRRFGKPVDCTEHALSFERH